MPQASVEQLGQAWELWTADPLVEGLVVVDRIARLGARRAKRKLKERESIDCVVVGASERVAHVRTFGCEFTVGCSGLDLSPGRVVEVAHEGRYRSGLPRFPRIVRRRLDLERSAA